MSSHTSSSSNGHRWRPVDPSQYVCAYRGELGRARPIGVTQILSGAIWFFILLAGWRWVSQHDWLAAGAVRPAEVAIQCGVAAVFMIMLLGADALVRRGLAWRHFRTGIILAALALAAFWIVRLAIWGVLFWLRQPQT